MSEPEDDRDFLDEIKALEDVLANEELSTAENLLDNDIDVSEVVVPRRGNQQSRGFGEVESPVTDSDDGYAEDTTGNTGSRLTLLETNKKLLELLREIKHEVSAILERCVENKAIVDEKIRTRARNAKSGRVSVCSAGMPYFKDAKHYPAPWNKDARIKIRNGELQVVQLRYTCPWTAKDRNVLWRAIRQEAAGRILDREKSALRESHNISKPINDETGDTVFAERSEAVLTESLNLPKNFKDMMGLSGTREFDWLKIAATDFDERHTADECRVMWRVFLRPEINRYKWSKEEDARLEALHSKYAGQDWDGIAEELNTQRSGYQCFIRYNSTNRRNWMDERTWTETEDRRLKLCVEKFKIGHYVPWGTVGRYMGGRSKGQVYYRWMYNASPHLKKGRFTEEEDRLLIEAVQKYGNNFWKISSCVMTNRSSVQLSDHYNTLMMRKRGLPNSWSINEDARLLVLHNRFGPDWSSIARKMTGKTRTQVRHRHKAITRYWDKGISLYEIPRDYKNSLPRFEDDENEDENGDEEMVRDLDRDELGKKRRRRQMEPVDAELVKYFQLIPAASKPGRKRKYYADEELEDMTRKLCIILKALGAELAIPEDLDEMTLTEKDKQLIESLNDYQRFLFKSANVPSRDISYGGINPKENDLANGEKHFAPLCSGDCNRGEKILRHDKIDYEPTSDLKHCRITLKMEFHDPETLVQPLGEETIEQFQRLVRLVVSPDSRTSNIRDLDHRLLSSSGQAKKVLSNPKSCEISEISSLPVRGTKKRLSKKQRPWNSSISEGVIKRLDETVCFVEPNYHTLLGLQHIISKAQTTGQDTIINEEFSSTTSEKAKRCMEILEKRLLQLFKYPIGLSHILRPEINVGSNASSPVENELEETDFGPEVADDCPKLLSPPSKKIRR